MAAQTPSFAERNVQARDNDRVYQAAGNQYFCGHPARMPAVASNTLPRGTAAFTGRDREVRTLLQRIDEPIDPNGTIPVQAIDGMPGVGKSTLAVHVGHLLGRRFPDGQFFIDLHAHSAGRDPVRPTDALLALLSADGMEPAQIPADVDSRAAQWRGRMAGKKALLILDNAADRSQVEQLLPGAAGCLVLVTSRRRLTGLSARHAALPLSLGTLPPEQAAALFAAMADRLSTGGEAGAIGELVRLCGFLPLAICLLAARLRPEPNWRVAELVRELSHARHRLSGMHAEDVAVAVAFDLSYHRLPAARRRFFRRLGLHPGADFDCHAAAALDAGSPERAQRQLDALYHDHLLDQPEHGRYRMHDLIGEYARARVEADPARDRAQALTRLLDHYQRGTEIADEYLSRLPGPRSSPPDGLSVAPPTFADRHEALAWLTAERGNLLACAARLPAGGDDRRVVAFAAALATYLRHAGPWDQAVALHAAAATAAGRIGDRHARANALYELGNLSCLSGDYGSAEEILRRALALFEELGRIDGAARTLVELGAVRRRRDDHRGAARDLERALALHQERGDRHGQARALDELGVVRHLTGEQRAAVDALRRALAIYGDTGDLRGQADALYHLGTAQQLADEYPPAIDAYQRALERYRDLGDRCGQARVLTNLGFALCRIGRTAAAEDALGEGLALHTDLGHPFGRANALNYLGLVHRHTADRVTAEGELVRALALYRDLGHERGQRDTLNQLGVLRRLAGDHGAASDLHQRALAIVRRGDDRLGQAEVHNELGALLLARAEPAGALEHYRDALALARAVSSRHEEAHAIEGSGRCALLLGRCDEAVEHLRQARLLYEQIGVPDADRVEADLAAGGFDAS